MRVGSTSLVGLAVFVWLCPVVSSASVVDVTDDASLQAALRRAVAGTVIRIAPGRYQPGVFATGLKGAPERPIVIEGADPEKPPLFEGGKVAWQLSDCEHVTLRNLAVRGQQANGINIDDGGSFDTPARHIVLEKIRVADVGPQGNFDGIKLSGVDDFTVRDCTVEGWGGQAIDMVGCHRGIIEGCTFRGKPGFSQSTGPQTKGGSSQIAIRRCLFLDAGSRAVNMGGSTGLAYFRPRGRSTRRGTSASRPVFLWAVKRPWPSWAWKGPCSATTRSTGRANGCCASCRKPTSRASRPAATAASSII